MSQVAEYVQGQRILVDAEFLLEGVAADPAVVTAEVRSPSGVRVALVYPSASLVRVDAGLYEAGVTGDEAGTYAIRFVGAGVVDAVGEVMVNVTPSRVV